MRLIRLMGIFCLLILAGCDRPSAMQEMQPVNAASEGFRFEPPAG